MKFEKIKSLLPDYAKDIKLNLSSLSNETILEKNTFTGTVLTSSLTTQNKYLTEMIVEEAREILTDKELNAAYTAASLMAMNNIYYRSIHLISNKNYQSMPANLRMNAITSHGIDEIDFELWSLAASAIKGCGMCLDSHESVLVKKEVSSNKIQAALRIASVINAANLSLDSLVN
tara:strand:- start:2488 stop:3012 length:525 start_codon:yes stop_codon:yes gene_type:complete